MPQKKRRCKQGGLMPDVCGCRPCAGNTLSPSTLPAVDPPSLLQNLQTNRASSASLAAFNADMYLFDMRPTPNSMPANACIKNDSWHTKKKPLCVAAFVSWVDGIFGWKFDGVLCEMLFSAKSGVCLFLCPFLTPFVSNLQLRFLRVLESAAEKRNQC